MIRVEIASGHWEIWSEPERGDTAVGRCIGSGTTLEEARSMAHEELTKDRAQLVALTQDMPVCWTCGTPLFIDADGKAEKPCGHAGPMVAPAADWLRLHADKLTS